MYIGADLSYTFGGNALLPEEVFYPCYAYMGYMFLGSQEIVAIQTYDQFSLLSGLDRPKCAHAHTVSGDDLQMIRMGRE